MRVPRVGQCPLYIRHAGERNPADSRGSPAGFGNEKARAITAPMKFVSDSLKDPEQAWENLNSGIEFWGEVAKQMDEDTSTPNVQIGAPVGEPGFGEGLIPVWGSGREAVNAFQTGHWSKAAFYGVLAISDVFLIRSLFKAGGKLLFETGAKQAGKEAAKEALKVGGKELAELGTEKFAQEAGKKGLMKTGAKATREAVEEAAAIAQKEGLRSARREAWASSIGKPSEGLGQLIRDLPKGHPARQALARMIREIRASGGKVMTKGLPPQTYARFQPVGNTAVFRYQRSKLRIVDLLEEQVHWKQITSGQPERLVRHFLNQGMSVQDAGQRMVATLETLAKQRVLQHPKLTPVLKMEWLDDLRRVRGGTY